jgi:hypothetical protein
MSGSNFIQVKYATALGRVACMMRRTALTSDRLVVLIIHENLGLLTPPTSWNEALEPDYDVVHAWSLDDRGAPPLDIRSTAARIGEAIGINFSARPLIVMGQSEMGTAALVLSCHAAASIRGSIAWDPPLLSSRPAIVSTTGLRAAIDSGRLTSFVRRFLGRANDRVSGAAIGRRALRESVVPVLLMVRETVTHQQFDVDEIMAALAEQPNSKGEGVWKPGALANVTWYHLERFDRTSFYEPSAASIERVLTFCRNIEAEQADIQDGGRRHAG